MTTLTIILVYMLGALIMAVTNYEIDDIRTRVFKDEQDSKHIKNFFILLAYSIFIWPVVAVGLLFIVINILLIKLSQKVQ